MCQCAPCDASLLHIAWDWLISQVNYSGLSAIVFFILEMYQLSQANTN
jgi:hypothetical protein